MARWKDVTGQLEPTHPLVIVTIAVGSKANTILDLILVGDVGIHDDFPYLARSQGIEPIAWRYLNSGVVLFDREHSDLWDPPRNVFITSHTIEQTWVEQSIRRRAYPIHSLELRWNTQWWQPSFGENAKRAYVVHLANAPHIERIAILLRMSRDRLSIAGP